MPRPGARERRDAAEPARQLFADVRVFVRIVTDVHRCQQARILCRAESV
jgi:hypothetical protein